MTETNPTDTSERSYIDWCCTLGAVRACYGVGIAVAIVADYFIVLSILGS